MRNLGLLILMPLCLGLPLRAQLHRGLWFWGSTTLPDSSSSPFGSATVVGDTTAENESISFFTTHNVKRIYGSYQNRPVYEPAVIAAWNAKLDAAGIQSQILLDGNAVNDPAEITNILSKITNRLINFNNSYSSDPPSQFDALHLDLEPQGLPEWDSGTPADKRDLLDDLLQAYSDIRSHLDSNGYSSLPIYADIPFFWDKLPADGGSIGWTDATDRDNWFAAIDTHIDGFSIMTFSKNSYATLADATLYERTGPLAEARVAIQPKCGPGELWPTHLLFHSVLHQLETNLGPAEAADIENYAFWRHAIDNCGISVGTPVIVASSTAVTGAHPWPPLVGTVGAADDDPTIVFPGIPGNLYTIRTATTLRDQWQDLITLQPTHPAEAEMFRVPVPADGPKRFWSLKISPDSTR